MSKTSELMVEAGIIPKNTLQQLVNWRLIPGDLEESHGKHLVKFDSSNELEVHQFVKDLGEALQQDMTSIKETELDQAGGYEKALLMDSHGGRIYCDVFVDRLGRVVVPMDKPDRGEITKVAFGANNPRQVIRIETRFLGDRPVAKVIYLALEESNV